MFCCPFLSKKKQNHESIYRPQPAILNLTSRSYNPPQLQARILSQPHESSMSACRLELRPSNIYLQPRSIQHPQGSKLHQNAKNQPLQLSKPQNNSTLLSRLPKTEPISAPKWPTSRIYPSLKNSSDDENGFEEDYENEGNGSEADLFEDDDFPAIDASIWFKTPPEFQIIWKRPHEIVDNPKFFSDGYSRFDVNQGRLGNCWLLAATATLTSQDALFQKVVPPNQSFTENYSGMFRFNFWENGHWVEVIIDDRLPTVDGKLAYMYSTDNTEFWPALFEKAFAKLFGSYEALEGGFIFEALKHLTGGLTESIDLKNPPPNLKSLMKYGMKMGSLFGCSINGFSDYDHSMGLVEGHAYSITCIKTVKLKEGPLTLIRIRNPWGNGTEWGGAWSDKWPQWTEELKRKLKLEVADDGEFWMTFKTFLKEFSTLDICHLEADVIHNQMIGSLKQKVTWSVSEFNGSWTSLTSGGCNNQLRTFARNPQYYIHVEDADPNDDDDLCTLIIGLMQKNRRKLHLEDLQIGFSIYKIKGNRGRLTSEQLSCIKPYAKSDFMSLPEITARLRVSPGEYLIIPYTSTPGDTADFMIQIFTTGIIKAKELLPKRLQT